MQVHSTNQHQANLLPQFSQLSRLFFYNNPNISNKINQNKIRNNILFFLRSCEYINIFFLKEEEGSKLAFKGPNSRLSLRAVGSSTSAFISRVNRNSFLNFNSIKLSHLNLWQHVRNLIEWVGKLGELARVTAMIE